MAREEIGMSKGDKRRGNREAKKPEAVKNKTPATTDFFKGETPKGNEKGKKSDMFQMNKERG
jgi:hypothetical protein